MPWPNTHCTTANPSLSPLTRWTATAWCSLATNTQRTDATVTFTGNKLVSIADSGHRHRIGYGAINLMPGVALTTGGLTVNARQLPINERPGTSMSFNGTSRVIQWQHPDRYRLWRHRTYTVNGTMNIDGTSTVNMDYVAVAGTGTFHLTGNPHCCGPAPLRRARRSSWMAACSA